jgi:uncharacterized membrane protein
MMTIAQQRRYEKAAALLLSLGLAGSVVVDYALNRGFFEPYQTVAQILKLLLFIPLGLVIYFFVYRGRGWAKKCSLVIYALSQVYLVGKLSSRTAYNTPLELADLIVEHTLDTAACVLLLLSLTKPSDGETAAVATLKN